MKNETFDFSEALRRMRDGKEVRRHSWEEEIFLFDPKRNEIMVKYHGRVVCARSIMVCYDILATDWEEVQP